MKENWVRIFSSTDLIEAKLVEDFLKQKGIESHIVNKPDSAIPAIGEAELFAPQERAAEAIKLLKEAELKK